MHRTVYGVLVIQFTMLPSAFTKKQDTNGREKYLETKHRKKTPTKQKTKHQVKMFLMREIQTKVFYFS